MVLRTAAKVGKTVSVTFAWSETILDRLQKGGVLLIDDYGCMAGQRAAVDEYIAENDIKVLLNRIDFAGRIGLKP